MPDSIVLKKIFEPIMLGQLELKNRIVMSPMAIALCDDYGYVTDKMLDTLEVRARGGASMIIAASASVEFPRGMLNIRKLSISCEHRHHLHPMLGDQAC